MSSQDYEVGQILFLIKPNKFSIVPAQIIEQITRKNLEGIQTIYNIKIPGIEQTLELNSFDGEVFKDINNVKIYLIEHAQKSIENLLKSCLDTAVQTFDYTPLLQANSSVDVANIKEKVVEIDLGDGQVGKMKMAENFSIDSKKKSSPPKRPRGRPKKKEMSE